MPSLGASNKNYTCKFAVVLMIAQFTLMCCMLLTIAHKLISSWEPYYSTQEKLSSLLLRQSMNLLYLLEKQICCALHRNERGNDKYLSQRQNNIWSSYSLFRGILYKSIYHNICSKLYIYILNIIFCVLEMSSTKVYLLFMTDNMKNFTFSYRGLAYITFYLSCSCRHTFWPKFSI